MANDNSQLLNQLKIDRGAPPSRAPNPSRRKWMIIGAIGVIAALVALAFLFLHDRPQEVETVTVESTAASGSSSGAVLDASGYIVARRIATVSSKVTGRVSKVLIEEGQEVSAGQVMATLDPIDADAQRDLAAAQVAAVNSQAGAIQAQLKEAQANVARLSSLARQQLVARAQLDQAIAQRDALAAQLKTVQRNTDVAGSQLRIARQGVDNTVVRAPFSGVVIAKAAQPGEIVSPLSAGGGFTRTGIGTIVDMDSLEVEVDVGENYIGRVQVGMPTETVLNAYPDWKIPGKVIAVIPTADRGKATIKVRVALDQRDARVVPDMGARVSFLETAKAEGVKAAPSVLVPSKAIVTRNGKSMVFIVVDNKSQQVEVKTGRSIGDDTEVTSGLSGGEVVITNPTNTMAPGKAVKMKSTTSEPEEK